MRLKHQQGPGQKDIPRRLDLELIEKGAPDRRIKFSLGQFAKSPFTIPGECVF